jgi:hypothetical protein
VLCALFLLPLGAAAQDAGRGFLFAPPTGGLTIRGGYALASAGSDFFDFTTDELTLNRRDFSSVSFDAELYARIRPRTDIVFWGSYSGMRKPSEYRHFIDNNDQPIEQRTTFQRIPMTIGVRQYLSSPGRAVGRLAWIPARAAAYVSAGGGMIWYQFRQKGDFIEMPSMDVFTSTYESSQWSWAAHGAVGLDYSLTARFALNAETRYLFSRGQLSSDFSGFDPLDLSGLSTMVGLTVRF